MKPALLETLLLDRALGELSPEVTALLDAHLAQNPDAARRAAELAATFSLARAANAAPLAAPRRPLDLARLRHAQRAEQSTTRRFEFLRLAACLALGLGLGWLARNPPPRVEIAAAIPRAAPALASPAAANPSNRFWSISRILAEEQARVPATNRLNDQYELHWNSPTKLPRLEEKL